MHRDKWSDKMAASPNAARHADEQTARSRSTWRCRAITLMAPSHGTVGPSPDGPFPPLSSLPPPSPYLPLPIANLNEPLYSTASKSDLLSNAPSNFLKK